MEWNWRPCVVKLFYFRGKGPCMVFIFSEVFAWECKPIGAGRILILSMRNGFMFLYSNDTLSGRCLVMLSHACGIARCVAGLQQNLATRRKSASYFPWWKCWSVWPAQAAVFSTCSVVERLVWRSSDANLPVSCSIHKLQEAATSCVGRGTKNSAEAKSAMTQWLCRSGRWVQVSKELAEFRDGKFPRAKELTWAEKCCRDGLLC